jgi:hypothetical protein
MASSAAARTDSFGDDNPTPYDGRTGMMDLRRLGWAALVATALVWTFAGCGGKEAVQEKAPPDQMADEKVVAPEEQVAPDWGLVTNGGFDGPEGWKLSGASVADGQAVLEKAPDAEFCAVSQAIIGLEPDARYVLSVRARADATPDAELLLDVIGKEGYRGGQRKLRVRGDEIGPEFRAFERVIPSDTPPRAVTLRVVSSSTVPVFVDDVALTKLD